MMKKKLNVYGIRTKESSTAATTSSSAAARDEETEWEMRPGGMLVQKRSVKTEAPTQNLRLRIAYGALRYEISVSSMATFGKMSLWIYILEFALLSLFGYFFPLSFYLEPNN